MVWRNFAISVWLLIGYGVGATAWAVMRAEEIGEMWGPFAARVSMGPAIYGVMETLLWFFVYRNTGQGARIMGGFMGCALAVQGILVPVLVSSVHDTSLNALGVAFAGYLSVSHLVFAAVGR